MQRCGMEPWVRKIPWRRKWQSPSSILDGKMQWTEEPGMPQSVGVTEIQKQLSNWVCTVKWMQILKLIDSLTCSTFTLGTESPPRPLSLTIVTDYQFFFFLDSCPGFNFSSCFFTNSVASYLPSKDLRQLCTNIYLTWTSFRREQTFSVCIWNPKGAAFALGHTYK